MDKLVPTDNIVALFKAHEARHQEDSAEIKRLFGACQSYACQVDRDAMEIERLRRQNMSLQAEVVRRAMERSDLKRELAEAKRNLDYYEEVLTLRAENKRLKGE
jgi:hypothetical protein